MVVVTGAPGHLGNNLVRELVQRTFKVRALALPGESIDCLGGLPVEVLRGDVRDFDFLCRAFEGADTVFHLASMISIGPGHWDLLQEVNVGGTRNVAEACLRTGVRRLVYTSSIHALVEPPHGVPVDESSPCDPHRIPTEYGKSKAMATLEVLKAVSRGLDAVILFPTGMIGPYDFRPSEAGRLLLQFAGGRIPFSLEGGFDFVDVRDVAVGHFLAAERGKTGERYILSGQWISVDEILRCVSQFTGAPVARVRLPRTVARVLARAAEVYSRFSGRAPLFTVEALELLYSNSTTSSEKARRELGYSPRPIRQTIEDTLRWFRQAGLLSR